MKPYYEDEKNGITIYCGDCRDVLPSGSILKLWVTRLPSGNLMMHKQWKMVIRTETERMCFDEKKYRQPNDRR